MAQKTVFVTGAAGFIGMHTALALQQRGDKVIGFDNFNAYYDPQLKERRAALLAEAGISLIRGDLLDEELLSHASASATHIVHLAAQAGVRYSIEHPKAYLSANIEGFLHILELCRRRHLPLVYASSSSVYGATKTLPFSTATKSDQPVNFYGATKKANELMAYSYYHLYGFPVTGLRFFTVYGPWGRPDMAYYSFTKAITEGKAINLYNYGHMSRDFTYIDDIVAGIMAALDRLGGAHVYNLGNHKTVSLLYFVEFLERALGKKAKIHKLPLQPGEMIETFADIEDAEKELGFHPHTSIEEGLVKFVNWYKAYHDLAN